MRLRTRVVEFLRSTPLEGATDWALLHVAPGASERRRHHHIDVETIEFCASVLGDDGSAIDVGAHTGAILKELVRISPDGRHHAVEPLPDLAAGLRSRFPSVVVHECVLGSSAFVDSTGGRTTINRSVDDPGYSSVVRTSHPRLDANRIEIVPVDVRTLDDVAHEIGPDLALVKIDVEGFEVEVLRGAEHLLAVLRPAIVLEHERVSDESSDSAELFSLLDAARYRTSRLLDWRTPRWLDLEHFEAANQAGDSYFIALPLERT